jgi:hypothetical protein
VRYGIKNERDGEERRDGMKEGESDGGDDVVW